MHSNYDLLISKINEFIQKFYLNKLLKGSIYTAGLLLALYLGLFVLIYYTQPGPAVKTTLFFSLIAIALLTVYFWILKPGLAYLNWTENLSKEQAATLIGLHFSPVKDKLINTLQLKTLADQNPENSQLILAGIEQKISELKPIPFASAIQLSENRRHVKYLLFPFSVILLIAIVAPAIWREGTSSLIQYDKLIQSPAPFRFELMNKQLRFSQGDDVTLHLKIAGDELPQEVYLSDGTNTYKLEKKSKTEFTYTFKNLQKNKEIHFSAAGFYSDVHLIEVKARPSVLDVNAIVSYPNYLKKASENIQHAGDLLLPEGSRVNWQISTENSNELEFIIGNHSNRLKPNKDHFIFKSKLSGNTAYSIIPNNQYFGSKDTLNHLITVIKDKHPTIDVRETLDSISSQVRYFSGNISDDYGFTHLKLNYLIRENNKLIRSASKTISINKDQKENTFFFMWRLSETQVEPGQVLEYYFEVADNDGVNGPKKTKSDIRTFDIPTQKQIAEKLNQGSAELKEKMEKAIRMATNVEKDSKKIAQLLLDKKQLSLDDKKQIEQLLQKQKQLEETVKEIKSLNEKNTFEKEENNAIKSELSEKQKQIDHLFNNVLDAKTRELLEKLQQMMNENNKQETQNELSKMQMDNKSLKNELDRVLELYKQLEFEQNLQKNIEKLDDLAKQQRDLAKKTATEDRRDGAANQKDPALEQLKKEQEKLSEDFKDLKKELEQLDQKNQEMERPNDFKNPKEESQGIQDKQKAGQEQLNQNKKKEAAEQQQKAGEAMEQLAREMKEMQQESESMENNLNVKELRQLLENLINTSFDQEKVMVNLRKMSSNDPLYTTNVQLQRRIKDNMKTIADSLFSLSKRVPQIESTVNEEMQQINFNIDKSLDNLGERNTGAANRNQQYAMTSINNLSLMLNEALDQLQNMQKNAKSGKGKKGNMQQLKQMQQQLNERMQQAREQIQKNGNQGTVPKGQMSQEFGKMAQQQQMIREALQKINREENKQGKGKLGDMSKTIEEMKATERDLVNKKLQQETMNRQKELLTKLLDAEKAEREQDEDNKRESKAAKEFPPSYKKLLENFKKTQQSDTEWLQKLPPNLNDYYKNKITEYFKLLNLRH